MEEIKVLQINSGSKQFGGVSSILYNLYSNIDRNKVQFDFLTPEESTYSLKKTEIESMGGNIFDFKINSKGLKKLAETFKQVSLFLNNNQYQIVHINSGSFIFNLVVSFCAKFSKFKPKVIVHSHNSTENKFTFKKLAINILKPLLLLSSDYKFACSKKAGQAMYPKWYQKNVRIILNGINLEKFKFDSGIREEARNKYGIKKSTFVLGNIGRMSYQKNQLFLLKVYREFVKYRKDSLLIIVGDGPELVSINEFITLNKLEQNVLLLSETDNVNELYCAFDIFVLSSRYEGLPLVGVEAQTTGLRVVASSEITPEVNISGLVKFIDLKKSYQYWANKMSEYNIDPKRRSMTYDVEKAGYKIEDVSKKVQKLYEEIGSFKNEKS